MHSASLVFVSFAPRHSDPAHSSFFSELDNGWPLLSTTSQRASNRIRLELHYYSVDDALAQPQTSDESALEVSWHWTTLDNIWKIERVSCCVTRNSKKQNWWNEFQQRRDTVVYHRSSCLCSVLFYRWATFTVPRACIRGTSASSNEQTFGLGWTGQPLARNSSFCHRKLTSVEKEKNEIVSHNAALFLSSSIHHRFYTCCIIPKK